MAVTHFSKQLTLLLARRGLTKYRLAQLSGLSTSYVGFLASGARSPSVDALKKLAPVLQVDLDELQAWVEASRLGEDGLAGLRRHLHLDAGGPQSVVEGLLRVMTAFAGELGAGPPSDEALQALLEAVREAGGAIGLALWQDPDRRGTLQITHHVGLPSEYVTIANLRLKEQGLEMGERFPVVEAYVMGQPVTVRDLLGNAAHGLHFYARILGFDRLSVVPVRHHGATLGVLAIYMPAQPLIADDAFRPWMDHATALLALGLAPACPPAG